MKAQSVLLLAFVCALTSDVALIASAQRQSLDRNEDRFQQPVDAGDLGPDAQQLRQKGDRRTDFAGGSSNNDDRNNRLSSTIFDRNRDRIFGVLSEGQRNRGRAGGYPSLDYPPSMVGLNDPNADPFPEPFNEDNEYYEPLSIREEKGRADSALSQRFGGPYDPSAENGSPSSFPSMTACLALALVVSLLPGRFWRQC